MPSFALLGDDPAALALAEAAQRQPGCLLAELFLAPRAARRWPMLPESEAWESLLLDASIGGAIVGQFAPSSEHDDRLRKLVQAGVPLLVVHPVCDAIMALELEMIRSDVGGIIVPYAPGLYHPAWPGSQAANEANGDLSQIRRQLTQVLDELEQLEFERPMAQRDPARVWGQLASDQLLLSQLAGLPHRVSASGARGEAARGEGALQANLEGEFRQLTVHCEYGRGIHSRWTMTRASADASAQLRLIGRDRELTIALPDDAAHWEWRPVDYAPGDAPRAPLRFAPYDDAKAAIETFAAAVQKKEQPIAWLTAARASEVAETAERSLARGRAIDLHQEAVNEEQTFKAVMAAGGCLLLLLLIVVLIVAVVADGLGRQAGVDNLPWIARQLGKHWMKIVLAVFVLFGLLQTLRFVFPPKRKGS